MPVMSKGELVCCVCDRVTHYVYCEHTSIRMPAAEALIQLGIERWPVAALGH